MDKEKLVCKIRQCGDTLEKLADALGLSLSCFLDKLNENGCEEFNQSEISKIRTRYALTNEEVLQIFFV